MTKELQDEGGAIPEVRSAVLDSLLDRLEFVAVVYYDRSLAPGRVGPVEPYSSALEAAAEEARMHDINFVLASDPRLVAALGSSAELPALVYYENNIPFVYSGRLQARR